MKLQSLPIADEFLEIECQPENLQNEILNALLEGIITSDLLAVDLPMLSENDLLELCVSSRIIICRQMIEREAVLKMIKNAYEDLLIAANVHERIEDISIGRHYGGEFEMISVKVAIPN